ncbi:MAG: aspartate ammonia-lyase [Candidatus Omnitrophica bacterium]|nr:aspartate ammonia-lyase [Candidatus Omnitrophota bacterium]
MMSYRIETDLLGEKKIFANVYWGIHTQRALENFSISGKVVALELVRAMALVKKAACLTNQKLGFLESQKSAAIVQACGEIIEGKLDQYFPLDALQGGAGTSTNMNVNEVIANRAIEILGGTKGEYSLVHPIEEVNKHQSTNDVYPTALKIAVLFLLKDLSGAVAELQGAFQSKEKEFHAVVKIGRTEMQDAVPMTLGQEFSAFAEAFSRDRWRVFKCEERIRTVNIGGSAIGTGLTAPKEYIFGVIEQIQQLSGLGICRAENVVDATANMDAFVEVFAILKAHAVNLVKVADDLRLLSMLGEIHLPQLQAGSSIMPGKVNPVMLEAVIQVGIKVMVDEQVVSQAASRGTLQINEFLPLLADVILNDLKVLHSINKLFTAHVQEIKADAVKCRENLDRSTSIVTAFIPQIGYEKCEQLIKQYDPANGTVRDFLIVHLGQELVDKILSVQNLTALGYRVS